MPIPCMGRKNCSTLQRRIFSPVRGECVCCMRGTLTSAERGIVSSSLHSTVLYYNNCNYYSLTTSPFSPDDWRDFPVSKCHVQCHVLSHRCWPPHEWSSLSFKDTTRTKIYETLIHPAIFLVTRSLVSEYATLVRSRDRNRHLLYIDIESASRLTMLYSSKLHIFFRTPSSTN